MSKNNKNRLIELEIDSLSSKGYGFGQCLNQAGHLWSIEVPFAIPGDRVSAEMSRKRSGAYVSFLRELLDPSPNRIAPRCVHFGTCGGCRWQQLPYEAQLKEKESRVRQWFAPYLSPLVESRPIFPCDPPWNYRNKMEFSFSSNLAKDQFLGLMMDNSKGKVFNLTECHLAHPWFAEALQVVKKWWGLTSLDAYHPPKNTGSLRNLTLREGQRTGDRMVVLTVSGNPDYAINRTDLESFVSSLRDAIEPKDPTAALSIFLRIQQIAKGSPTQFYEMQLYGPDTIREILHIQTSSSRTEKTALEFHISPTAFFQPNTRQAENLYSLALQMASIPPHAVVYDLYCGTGTLGICAAKTARYVLGIELSPESVLDARANATKNQLENVTILQGDVGKVLAEIQKDQKYPLPDVVMVDPPRVGLDENAIRNLLMLKPKIILYISCNPMTQASNIGKLLEQGYRLKAIQPVDQFPHTVHIENIAILERSSV